MRRRFAPQKRVERREDDPGVKALRMAQGYALASGRLPEIEGEDARRRYLAKLLDTGLLDHPMYAKLVREFCL